MNMLYRYNEEFKDVVVEVMEYFRDYVQNKSVMNFVREYNSKYAKNLEGDYVLFICSRLEEERVFHKIPNDIVNPIRNNYRWIVLDTSFNWTSLETGMRHVDLFNSTVFGFDYVFNLYKKLVYPIVTKNREGKIGVGTGFAFGNGIATAKHCLIDPKEVAIQGFDAVELNAAKIYISQNINCDLAFIELTRNLFESYSSDPNELEDVLVMGYPKIPQFVDFLTAEKALATFVKPSTGSIASNGFNFVTREDLMLLTAKIKGGNSGSPVLNKYGVIKGIAVRDLIYEDAGDYDDLGYGIAYPINTLEKLISEKKLINKRINFVDVSEIMV